MSGPRRELLIFEVGGRRYGLPGADVREVVRAVAIDPLPGAGAAIEGVVNLRGKVIVIHDLRWRLGLPGKDVEPSDQMIVFGPQEHPAAIRIDHAVGLIGAEVDEVGASRPELAPGTLVTLLKDGIAPILNLSALLAPVYDSTSGATPSRDVP